jgi:pimeloyl-ACP methyl ester carboxylesterase
MVMDTLIFNGKTIISALTTIHCLLNKRRELLTEVSGAEGSLRKKREGNPEGETHMTKTGIVHTEGANIVYDYEGDGPLLLTIAGGGGDAIRYAPISRMLADAYTVVSYDRRGNSRSTGDVSVALDMAQSAREAAAVIRAMGVEKAYVFGNSGGANIGLKLAEVLPEVITGLVVHEPPVIAILPDAETWRAFVQKVYETYATQVDFIQSLDKNGKVE